MASRLKLGGAAARVSSLMVGIAETAEVPASCCLTNLSDGRGAKPLKSVEKGVGAAALGAGKD